MEVATHYDANFILQVYSGQLFPKFSLKSPFENAPEVQKRLTSASESLAGHVVQVSQAIIKALQKDTNSTTLTISIVASRIKGEYEEYEQALRHIINDLFFVTIEQSEESKKRSNRSSYNNHETLHANLPISWEYKRQEELKLTFGVKDARGLAAPHRQNSFRKDGKYCDVCFLVNKTEFPAHKVVLAEYPEYFETFFCSDFKDAKIDAPIPFGDEELTAKVFETFLTYIYTQNIDFSTLSVEEIIALGNLSKLALDKKLQALCTSKLLSSITIESCFQIAQYAMCHDEQRLVVLCKSFLAKNKALTEALKQEVLTHKLSLDQIVAIHDVAEHLHADMLQLTCARVLMSQLNKDVLEVLCSAVAKSKSDSLKDAFKKEAYNFATNNTQLMSEDAMKPARQAYKALMTGLAPAQKKQKVE
jgi:hypothetical protein